MHNSVENKVFDKIKQNRRGKIFFTKDFAAFGSYDSCNKALENLAKKGKILRVSRGIYTIPKTSKFSGLTLTPSVDDIVRNIMKRENAKIIPTGLFALNMLNLSTQMPANTVFLTDGTPRKFKIGKVSVILKKATPSNFATKGKLSTLAIQALKSLKKDLVTDDEKEKIINILKKENPQHLKHDINFAPAWIQEILSKALTKNN
jgi:hypothetical protein